jgi:hypothetical protein
MRRGRASRRAKSQGLMTFVPTRPENISHRSRWRLGLRVASVAALLLVSCGELQRSDSHPGPSAGAGDTVLPRATVPDNEVRWRNEPGFSLTAPVVPSRPGPSLTWSFRIDREGFRGKDRAPVSDAEVFRILCVGDSVTFGFNVDQHRDYPAVLQQLLVARYPAHRFEVLNSGVPEWSWVQGVAFLMRDGFSLHPAVVVIAHGVADRAPTTVTDSERIWLNHWRSNESGSVRWLRNWLGETIPTTSQESPGCRLQEATLSTACQRVSPGEIGAVIRQAGAAAKAAGVELILANLDFTGTAAVNAVHEAAIREDYRFLDIAARMRTDQLRREMIRSRELGLALPRVPMVPFGRIGPKAPEGRGARMRFRVTGSPRAAMRVRGQGPEASGFRFDEEMRDDGSEGDEKSGDGVYSTYVTTLPSVSELSYRFFSDGNPEFEAPASSDSSHTDRTIRFNRDGDAPIAIFGVRPLMSDNLHPDGEGQKHIAETFLREIEATPSFRRYVEKTPLPGSVAVPAGKVRETSSTP